MQTPSDSPGPSLAVGSGEARLVFVTEPSDTEVDQAIPVIRVGFVDQQGNKIADAREPVTLRIIKNPGSSTLTGRTTVTPENGIATFVGLTIDRVGTGYALKASADNASSAASSPFDITLTFASVTAGHEHTCAVTITGDAYCWGANTSGELGDGHGRDAAAPSRVAGGLRYSSASAGKRHTCGVAVDGTPYCWGYGINGQLGVGYAVSSEPQPVPVAMPGGARVGAVSAGANHTCASGLETGQWCWGDNTYAQIIDNPFGTKNTVLAPRVQLVATNQPFPVAVSAGRRHTCTLRTDDTIWCRGSNINGQLGTGNSSGTSLSDVRFTTLTLQSADHTCAVEHSGDILCWGANAAGQLGNGGTQNATGPSRLYTAESLDRVSAGAGHTCALDPEGRAFCWGANNFGQLGTTALTEATDPVPVDGLHQFSSIDAGGAHTCGVTGSGVIYCWGGNTRGQLGDGTSRDSSVPVRVAPPGLEAG